MLLQKVSNFQIFSTKFPNWKKKSFVQHVIKCLTVDFDKTIFYIFFLNVGFLVFSNFFPTETKLNVIGTTVRRFLGPNIRDIFYSARCDSGQWAVAQDIIPSLASSHYRLHYIAFYRDFFLLDPNTPKLFSIQLRFSDICDSLLYIWV